ncbi:MAG: helicase, partial [Ignavibacteriales bacterium CG_4_9_14_3_um_filter_30_11]
KLLESSKEDKKQQLSEHFYELLDKNKNAFLDATIEDIIVPEIRRGRDSALGIRAILKAAFKNTMQLTDDQELYLKKVLLQLEEGGLPKQTTKETLKALNNLGNDTQNPFRVLAILQTQIPERLLESHYAENNPAVFGKREVILSMYLM